MHVVSDVCKVRVRTLLSFTLTPFDSRARSGKNITLIFRVHLWSTRFFFKSCGVPARAFDVLHALGITMSSRWTTDALAMMAASGKKDTLDAVAQNPGRIIGVHDNVNFNMHIFSQ